MKTFTYGGRKPGGGGGRKASAPSGGGRGQAARDRQDQSIPESSYRHPRGSLDHLELLQRELMEREKAEGVERSPEYYQDQLEAARQFAMMRADASMIAETILTSGLEYLSGNLGTFARRLRVLREIAVKYPLKPTED